MNKYQVSVRTVGDSWKGISVNARHCVVTEEGELYLYGGKHDIAVAIFARDMWRDVIHVEECCDG